jgi:hypothetical protein
MPDSSNEWCLSTELWHEGYASSIEVFTALIKATAEVGVPEVSKCIAATSPHRVWRTEDTRIQLLLKMTLEP